MKKITLGIEGMSCAACSNSLEKHLNKQNGILSASVNLVMANATIEYDETVLDEKKLDVFVKEAGFKSTGPFKLIDEDKAHGRQKGWLIAFGVLSVVFLYFTMGAMLIPGLPVPRFLSMHESPQTFAPIICGITVLYLVYGFDIIKNGFKTLFHLAPNMDTLVTLGVFSSFGFSIYQMIMIFLGNAEAVHLLYFESCAIIIFFIKLGRFIDKASKNKTKQAIKDLVQITPSTAFVKTADGEKEVSIDEIKKGDTVVCHAGEKIAVDGTITFGSAHIDESFITGESKPASKKQGDRVIAGSVNFDGYLEYNAEKIGKDSTISEIVRLVVEATNTKMPIAKIADKVSGIFVPVVMGIAVLAFAGYLIFGQGITTALTTFVTVLVVACPCSLGLATPLAIVVSEGKCASDGVLVKKSETLELANKVNAIVFDKTGTLTFGNLKIAKLFNYSQMTDEEVLRLAFSLESLSSHPIGKAFVERAKQTGLEALPMTDFENLSGLGISGKTDGKTVLCGNAKLLEKFGVKNDRKDDEKALAEQGNSIVYLAVDGELAALFGVNDVIKDNAKEIIEKLRKRKAEVIMLTGDNQATAEMIAKELGIDRVIANVLPNEKAKLIKKLKAEGKITLMCGDGINDSPALASAHVGVSVHNGTDIAMNSSDVILMSDNLAKIDDLLLISKKTVTNIKQNLFWAFFYNALMIPIALGALRFAGVVINPMIAGIAMVLSSLTVIFNALRLRWIKLNNN